MSQSRPRSAYQCRIPLPEGSNEPVRRVRDSTRRSNEDTPVVGAMSSNKRHLVEPALAQERRGVVREEAPVDDREELACAWLAVNGGDDGGQRCRAEARHCLGRVVRAPDSRGHVGEAILVGRGVGEGVGADALNNLWAMR